VFPSLLLLAVTFIQNPVEVKNNHVLMRAIEFAPADANQELSRPLLMDVAFPTKTKEGLPAIIFVHGGGWSNGKRQDGSRYIELFAEGGYFAATIDYRLSREAGFPAAVHDCKAAIRFLRTNANSLGVDPNRIGIIGVSAGGHLATLAGCSADNTYLNGAINGRDESTEVVCIGSISGAVRPQNSTGNGKKMYEAWALHDSSVELALTLPEHYLDKNDPPIYLLCGEKDMVCPVKEAESFVQILKSKAVPFEMSVVPNQGHQISEPSAYVGLLSFLDKHLGGHAETSFEEFLEKRETSGRGRK